MSDPLTVAASVLGVVVPALHGTRLLQDDITKIVDAPAVVKSLNDDLASLDATLRSLKAIEEGDWDFLGDTITAQCRNTVSACERACETFRSDLQRWTKRSKGGALSWRDRAKIGFFKESQIKAISEHLQSCKLTCSNVVGFATLCSSLRNSRITQDVKDGIAKKEADLTISSQSMDDRLAEVENSLTEMGLVDAAQYDTSEVEDLESAVAQLQEEIAALKASRALLPELLSRIRSGKIEKIPGEGQDVSTIVSFGSQNTGFQVGISHGAISGVTVGK